MRIKGTLWILMAIILLSAVASLSPVARAEPTPLKNVMMFYMCGDNEFSKGIMDTLDTIRDAGGSDNDVTIIAMIDTIDGTTFNGIPYDDGMYYIGATPAQDVKLWTPPSELVINDPANLSFFINYVSTNYPANRYILTIWDHGSGLSVLEDRHSSPKDMDIKVLGNTLRASGVHFNIIQFEACLMGMTETAYELRNVADVAVASENMDYFSRPYQKIITWLKVNPTAPAADIGKQIVDGYIDPSTLGQGTLAVTDLSKMQDVASSMDNLADVLDANLPAQQSAVVAAVAASQHYDPYSNFVDVVDLMDNIDSRISDPQVQAATGAVRTSVNNAVLYEKHKGPDVANSHGLSINAYDGVTYHDSYSGFKFTDDTSWDEFLLHLTQSPMTFSALTVDPAMPFAGSPFHILGSLRSDHLEKIYLQKWNGRSWEDIKSTISLDGDFDFSTSENTAGIWTYRVHYPGSLIKGGFMPSNSAPVDVNVVDLAITYPSGGETFATGFNGGFDWVSDIDENLKVTLYKDKIILQSWTVSESSGEQTFIVPGEWGVGDDYKFCINTTVHPNIGRCNGTFTITNPITVISPNGGNYWKPGSTHTIKWGAEICSGQFLLNCLPEDDKVKVQIIKGSSKTVKKTFDNDGLGYNPNGQLDWTVDLPEATDYKVKVASLAKPDIYDTSDWWFYIKDYTYCFEIGGRRVCPDTPIIDLAAILRGSSCPPICPILDIARIFYYATGAVNIPLTEVPGDAAFPIIDKEGITTLTYYTEDSLGNVGPMQTYAIMIDRTAPEITIKTPIDGAIYLTNEKILADWSVNDPLSGVAASSGTKASGTAIDTATSGTKTFSVQATDNVGTAGTISVTYIVQTPAQATQDLSTRFDVMGLPADIEKGLKDKLASAQMQITQGKTIPARNTLQAFINMVKAQSGKAITSTQADNLISEAQRIINAIPGN